MQQPLFALPVNQDEIRAEELERDFAEQREGPSLRRATFPYGGVGWIATQYDAVREVLADPRFSLAEAARIKEFPRIRVVESSDNAQAFISMDPPLHTQKRSVLMKHLSVKRIRAHRPRAEQIVEEHLDHISAAGSPADLAETYARSVPVTVLADLLGAPPEERERFIPSAHLLSNARARTPEESQAAMKTINDYFSELVERKRTTPGDDVISALVHDTDVEAAWTDEELRGAGVALLLAGHDATSAILGGSIEWLIHNPEVLQQVRVQPDFFPSLFDELMRFLPAGLAGTRSRIALEDVTIGDTLVRAGEAVLPIVHAANYDENVFPDPEQVIVGRPMDRPHVGFGYGAHSCVGRQLATMEIDVAITRLLARFPDLKPMQDKPDWSSGRLLRGPKKIEVTW